ncbi:hypothetical protein [Stenotrophomonas sp.]|uniref:hypothetical protein n=1 Tax=Stenotrophomonas sp. TaxID=69392 RepID=UPI0028A06152|nr:hypothetical protein [Stenotrophomonas sp.]
MRTLLLLWLPFTAAATPLLRTEGVATTASGVVAYREVHWQRGASEGAQRLVQYLCPDGQPFARKQMPATASAQARGYTLEDRRSGQLAQVQVTDSAVGIDWKEDESAKRQVNRITLPASAVVDAGFDAAVRARWNDLLGGKALSLPFLVPGRARFYPVSVVHQGPARWQGQSAQSFEVRLDTWYGGLAPRLSLVYADSDRRLLEFRGTSNLRDEGGKYPSVTVRFAAPAKEQPADRWQAALAAPLVGRCSVSAP